MAAHSAVVPFSLSLPKESTVNHSRVLSKAYQVRGVARLERDRFTLEWSGSIEITEVTGRKVRHLRESVPAQRLVLAIRGIASIELRSRWWRPRIELRTTAIAPLDLVPSAMEGRLTLQIGRRDWRVASELVSRMQLEMAEAALRDAEGPSALPRESNVDR